MRNDSHQLPVDDIGVALEAWHNPHDTYDVVATQYQAVVYLVPSFNEPCYFGEIFTKVLLDSH